MLLITRPLAKTGIGECAFARKRRAHVPARAGHACAGAHRRAPALASTGELAAPDAPRGMPVARACTPAGLAARPVVAGSLHRRRVAPKAARRFCGGGVQAFGGEPRPDLECGLAWHGRRPGSWDSNSGFILAAPLRGRRRRAPAQPALRQSAWHGRPGFGQERRGRPRMAAADAGREFWKRPASTVRRTRLV
jgi:hypothetical protein